MTRAWFVAFLVVSCKHGPPHEAYETTRVALRAQQPAIAEPWGAVVDELERAHASTVYVSVFADLASTDAATEWLKTHADAYPDATISKVFPYYTTGVTPGGGVAVRELTSAFARIAPNGALRFAQDDDKAVGPRVLVTLKVTPTSAFASPGGHRAYAALDCTYSASIRVASGAAEKPFAGSVVASSPDTITVTRMVFKGDKLPELGAEPSILEDSLVYTTMIEKCGAEAIPKLVNLMVPSGKHS